MSWTTNVSLTIGCGNFCLSLYLSSSILFSLFLLYHLAYAQFTHQLTFKQICTQFWCFSLCGIFLWGMFPSISSHSSSSKFQPLSLHSSKTDDLSLKFKLFNFESHSLFLLLLNNVYFVVSTFFLLFPTTFK